MHQVPRPPVEPPEGPRRIRSRVVWVGAGLTAIALALGIGWTFVPATVHHGGTQITCNPGMTDRSSPAAEVSETDLACRPVADRRERQLLVAVPLALAGIWAGCGIALRRRSHAGAPHG